MKQIDGGKDSVLTWGGLIGKRSTLGNLSREGVAERSEVSRSHSTIRTREECGRAEQLREN